MQTKQKISKDTKVSDIINWCEPWFSPFAEFGQKVIDEYQDNIDLYISINKIAKKYKLPIEFTNHDAAPPEIAYESFIKQNKKVPTRSNWHDFFNALVWAKFPQLKTQLNALQATEIQKSGITSSRGALRDAITLLDENGALLIAPDEIWDALIERHWLELFSPHALRPMWDKCQIIICGHAALEKLINPYKSITVHVWRINAEFKESIETIDKIAAENAIVDELIKKPFTPLPILGVPNWFKDNEDMDFYKDENVFRQKRIL